METEIISRNTFEYMPLIPYIWLLIYITIPAIILYVKRIEIWKGLCGGNGIPQPNEVVKIPAFFGIYLEIAQVIILRMSTDIEMLIFLGTILGLASLPHLKTNMKSSPKENEKE